MQRRPEPPETLTGADRLSPVPTSLPPSNASLEPRPLPSVGVTRFHRYYEPLRHPRRPHPSLAGGRLARARHRQGLPVLLPSPSSMRAAATTPAEPAGARVARFPANVSLPRDAGGSASASPVSRPARRSLALRPAWSLNRLTRPVTSECFSRSRYLLQPLRLLPAGATVAGRDSHPPGNGALPRRTATTRVAPTGAGGLAAIHMPRLYLWGRRLRLSMFHRRCLPIEEGNHKGCPYGCGRVGGDSYAPIIPVRATLAVALVSPSLPAHRGGQPQGLPLQVRAGWRRFICPDYTCGGGPCGCPCFTVVACPSRRATTRVAPTGAGGLAAIHMPRLYLWGRPLRLSMFHRRCLPIEEGNHKGCPYGCGRVGGDSYAPIIPVGATLAVVHVSPSLPAHRGGRVGDWRGCGRLVGVAVVRRLSLCRCLTPRRGSVSSRRSSNRMCGFPASGSRTRSCLRPRKTARSRGKAGEAHVVV